MIDVKLVKDTQWFSRICTFELTYPRYIHAQMLTHRVFSRNTSSSRAIPVDKLIQAVEDNPVFPSTWGKNKAGMQAEEALKLEEGMIAGERWHDAYKNAISSAKKLAELGVHKQIVNRLLEPFSHVTVILTGTEFDNFFELRCWKKGEIGGSQEEIALLAELMKEAMTKSTPTLSPLHIPYSNAYPSVTDEEIDKLTQNSLRHTLMQVMYESIKKSCYGVDLNKTLSFADLVCSVVKAARVSYTSHNTVKTFEDDLKLFLRLFNDKHLSPFEHTAVACDRSQDCQNLRNFRTLRHILDTVYAKL